MFAPKYESGKMKSPVVGAYSIVFGFIFFIFVSLAKTGKV